MMMVNCHRTLKRDFLKLREKGGFAFRHLVNFFVVELLPGHNLVTGTM